MGTGSGPVHHNGRTLYYPIDDLGKRCVNNTIVKYIGQAGGKNKKGDWSDESLSSRIKTFMRYGQGQVVSHRGGRSIWQIQDFKNLVLCWKPLTEKIYDPKQYENEMIRQFKDTYGGMRPFANLRG